MPNFALSINKGIVVLNLLLGTSKVFYFRCATPSVTRVFKAPMLSIVAS